MHISYYCFLPDNISEKEVTQAFEKIIEEKDDFSSFSEVLECVLEVSERQFNTYKYIDNEIKRRIEGMVIDGVDLEDLEEVETAIIIAVRIGAQAIFNHMVSNKSHIENVEVRNEISNAVAEMGEDISDPYFFLK